MATTEVLMVTANELMVTVAAITTIVGDLLQVIAITHLLVLRTIMRLNLNHPRPTPALSPSGKCDQSLWNHVYNPARLEVVESCKTVSGTIDSIRVERDGDFHVRLKLDPQFSKLINLANIDGQFGDLVVEPICINPVTQADAISASENFHQDISIPHV